MLGTALWESGTCWGQLYGAMADVGDSYMGQLYMLLTALWDNGKDVDSFMEIIRL